MALVDTGHDGLYGCCGHTHHVFTSSVPNLPDQYLDIPCCEDGSILPHRLLSLFRKMAQFKPLHCYTDEEISINLYLADDFLKGVSFSCSSDHAKMLYAAHLFEIGKCQATEQAGALAEVSKGTRPSRPTVTPHAEGLQAGMNFWEIGLVYSLWGQQLRTFIHSVVIGMIAL